MSANICQKSPDGKHVYHLFVMKDEDKAWLECYFCGFGRIDYVKADLEKQSVKDTLIQKGIIL